MVHKRIKNQKQINEKKKKKRITVKKENKAGQRVKE